MRPSTIQLYTTPGCPDCAALKDWLRLRGVAYEERDLSAPGVAEDAKARYGVRVAPITVVGDTFYFGTFAQQKPQLEAMFDGH